MARDKKKKMKISQKDLVQRIERTLRGRVSSKIPSSSFVYQDIKYSSSSFLTPTGSGAFVGRNYLARDYGSYAGATHKISRYSDFDLMDAENPIVNSALDIYAANVCMTNSDGEFLTIYSENSKIRDELERLFFVIMNLESNLPLIARTMCKYGDAYGWTPIIVGKGIVDFTQFLPSEIDIEEQYKDGKQRKFYKWMGSTTKKYSKIEVAHFQIMADPILLPYGKAVLDSCRRPWKQLKMLEDGMMIYKVSRSPETRIFKIDVGNLEHNKVKPFIDQVMGNIKRQPLISDDGSIDSRYSPLSVVEDIVIPTRGEKSSTDVTTLPGVQGFGMDEVEYILKTLFAALKVPRAFLTYDDEIKTKATLLMEDSRFAYTVKRIQNYIISELRKTAVIHLLAKGFTEEDAFNFQISMTHPSAAEESLRIQALSEKVGVITSLKETGVYSMHRIQKQIMGLTEKEIVEISAQRVKEAEIDWVIDQIKTNGKQNVQAAMGSAGEVDRSTIRRLMLSMRPGEEVAQEGAEETAADTFGGGGGGGLDLGGGEDDGGLDLGGGEEPAAEGGGDLDLGGGGAEESTDFFSMRIPPSDLIHRNKKKTYGDYKKPWIESKQIDEFIDNLYNEIEEG